MKSESKDIKAQLANKTEEFNNFTEEHEKLKTQYEKKVAKLSKQLETQVKSAPRNDDCNLLFL